MHIIICAHNLILLNYIRQSTCTWTNVLNVNTCYILHYRQIANKYTDFMIRYITHCNKVNIPECIKQGVFVMDTKWCITSKCNRFLGLKTEPKNCLLRTTSHSNFPTASTVYPIKHNKGKSASGLAFHQTATDRSY